jgi:hypothetical protein
MKKYRKIFSISFELAGLTILLFASIWQFVFTDWFDTELLEWQFMIQRDMTYEVLDGISNIGYYALEKDENTKRDIADKIIKNAGNAQSVALAERDRRSLIKNRGQAKKFNTVKFSLFILGAVLIVLGKSFQLIDEISNMRVQGTAQKQRRP